MEKVEKELREEEIRQSQGRNVLESEQKTCYVVMNNFRIPENSKLEGI